MKCYFPRNVDVMYPVQTSTLLCRLVKRADLFQDPDCSAHQLTFVLTLFDFKLTFPANPCGFFLVNNKSNVEKLNSSNSGGVRTRDIQTNDPGPGASSSTSHVPERSKHTLYVGQYSLC